MTVPFLSPQHVARRLGLSTSRVMQLDREGKLHALRDSSGRRLYDPDTVEQFARAREEEREGTGSELKPVA